MSLEKTERKERIIQFGEGGFLRGFVDWMIQKMNNKHIFNGNIVIVQPIEKGMCDTLNEQNCVYTHVTRGKDGIEKEIVNSISRCINPYSDFEAYLKLAENPDFRFIVSNTTEAGIQFSKGDMHTDEPPKSFPAKVAVLLKKRYELGLPGFIFLPCELIEHNGDQLKKCILQYAELWNWDEEFKRWIEKENVFTNTLVDRINTGYSKEMENELDYEDKMLNASESFHLWVIETECNLLQEMDFASAGLNVIVTKNQLELYHTRKVRILNGAHTAMVCYALLEGKDTVKDCMDDPKIYAYVKRCIFDEIIPTLNLSKEELEEYATSVLERFDNPYIEHRLRSIVLNSVSKFKVRVLPSIIEYEKRYHKSPKALLFSWKKLIEFYQKDEPNDDDEVIAFMKSHTLSEILANTVLWGADFSYLEEEIKHADS